MAPRLRVGNDEAPGSAVAGPRQQVELLGPADRSPTVVHTELGVDVLGVSPHGVQGHDELAGDVRAVQVASEQPKHVQLAFAQWLDQALLDGRAALGLVNGCQESTDIARGDPLLFAMCSRATALSREAMGGPSSTKTRT